METQLYLFDLVQFSSHPALNTLRWEFTKGWHPFSVDIVQKAATLHGLSCGIVLDRYESYKHEQLSNNSDD